MNAELPRVMLDTKYSAPTGNKLRPTTAAELQTALNNAQPGDEILLPAAAVFVGNLPLRKFTATTPIHIRTDTTLPAEGQRVRPADAARFAKILTTNNEGALSTAPGAHDWRLVGVEVGMASQLGANLGGLVRIGSGVETAAEDLPARITLDRCFIHGEPSKTLRRGVALHGYACAIIDSLIAECHENGADSQAICGWNGPGPYKITNCQLEAAGENFMLGGADAKIAGLIASDVEFRRNTLVKPPSWNPRDPAFAGVKWSVKNLFELKNARRVLVEGNTMDGCWVDAQTGYAVQLTPRGEDGRVPWATVADVTFINNIVRNAAAGLSVLGRDDNGPSDLARRIKVANNLWLGIGLAQQGGNGRLFQLLNGADYISIRNNTAMHTGNVLTLDGAPITNAEFADNIMPHNEYGVFGSGQSVGLPSINAYLPGAIFTGNVLIGGPATRYPVGNYFPATVGDVGFVDPSNGDYRVKTASPYFIRGADINAIVEAMSGPPAFVPPESVSTLLRGIALDYDAGMARADLVIRLAIANGRLAGEI